MFIIINSETKRQQTSTPFATKWQAVLFMLDMEKQDQARGINKTYEIAETE